MKIIPSGLLVPGSRMEMVHLTATTPEDKEALRVLYNLFHKIGSTEVLVSLSEAKLMEEGAEYVRLLFK